MNQSMLQKLNRLNNNYRKIEEYSSIEADYNRLQTELKQMKQTNTEYSTRITELSTKLNQVTEEAKSKRD